MPKKKIKIKKIPKIARFYECDEEKIILENAEKIKKLNLVNQNNNCNVSKKIQIKETFEEIKTPINKSNNKSTFNYIEPSFSRNIFQYLRYDNFCVFVGCNKCFIWSSRPRKYQFDDCKHDCSCKMLMLKKRTVKNSEYIYIREPPLSLKVKRFDESIKNISLCEEFLNERECPEKERCPYPHNELEKTLWFKFFLTSKSIYVDFLKHMKCSRLHFFQILENILFNNPGILKMVCSKCLKENIQEANFCSKINNIHSSWNDNLTLALINNGSYLFEKKLEIILQPLYQLSLNDKEIIIIYKQLNNLEIENQSLEKDIEPEVDDDLLNLKMCYNLEAYLNFGLENIFQNVTNHNQVVHEMKKIRPYYLNYSNEDISCISMDNAEQKIPLLYPCLEVCKETKESHLNVIKKFSQLGTHETLQFGDSVEIMEYADIGHACEGSEVIVEIIETNLEEVKYMNRVIENVNCVHFRKGILKYIDKDKAICYFNDDMIIKQIDNGSIAESINEINSSKILNKIEIFGINNLLNACDGDEVQVELEEINGENIYIGKVIKIINCIYFRRGKLSLRLVRKGKLITLNKNPFIATCQFYDDMIHSKMDWIYYDERIKSNLKILISLKKIDIIGIAYLNEASINDEVFVELEVIDKDPKAVKIYYSKFLNINDFDVSAKIICKFNDREELLITKKKKVPTATLR